MDGPHNLGGRQGFGPLEIERDEPVFHEPWEARMFGLAFSTWTTLWVGFDEFREAVIEMTPQEYLSSSYYERWLHATETLIERKGLPPQTETETMADNIRALIDGGLPRDRPAPSEPAFSLGDQVRARVINPRTYTRLPSYLRGRRGVIAAYPGSFWHPEDLARGELAGPGGHCYTVRFSAADLWGPDAENPDDSVCTDLFENYLEPA